MKILVLQHERVEHPGSLRGFLERDGHQWQPVHLNEGETAPALDGFDALWVMGGPMDVWEEDEHPWLAGEKALIRDAVEDRGMPFLGLCLGHQLLAEALGGRCGPSTTPEIGVLDVHLTGSAAASAIFSGLPATFPALQWHSAEISQMPAGAECLATSPDCAVQAMSWGPRATSMQFHVEVEADTFRQWLAIPAYARALEKALGEGGAAVMEAACVAQLATFNAMAEQVYRNWLRTPAAD